MRTPTTGPTLPIREFCAVLRLYEAACALLETETLDTSQRATLEQALSEVGKIEPGDGPFPPDALREAYSKDTTHGNRQC